MIVTSTAFDLVELSPSSGANAELLLGLSTNGSDSQGEDLPHDQSIQADGPLITQRGPGGQPVVVSSLHMGQSLCDPAAVLATLPASESRPDADQQFPGSPAPPPCELPGTLRRGDELACASLFRAACGMMLGVGLTIGPLYPDLLPLVRKFLPRRISRKPAQANTRREKTGSPRHAAPARSLLGVVRSSS